MSVALRQVIFRTDARPEIGYGHFFRCLALAQAFTARGTHCVFASQVPDYMRSATSNLSIMDNLPGGLSDWDDPAFVAALENSDILITDLYEIGPDWQRKAPIPIMAITDPPFRRQHCDLLLLPTSFSSPDTGPSLTAPAHSLIRSDIVALRTSPKTGQKLLVNCGGGEDHGLTLRVIKALSSDKRLIDISGAVVLGNVSNAYARCVSEAMNSLQGMTLTCSVADMGSMLAGHDWAVGTPSGSALERACLGLAQVLVPIADNQHALGDTLQEIGVACTLAPDAGIKEIATTLYDLRRDTNRRSEMAIKGFRLFDGQGANRVVDFVEKNFGRPV